VGRGLPVGRVVAGTAAEEEEETAEELGSLMAGPRGGALGRGMAWAPRVSSIFNWAGARSLGCGGG
jgi:hypothetical protein